MLTDISHNHRPKLEFDGLNGVRCPICGNSFSIAQGRPEQTGFWSHYFGRASHAPLRPRSDEHSLHIKHEISRILGERKRHHAEQARKHRETAELRQRLNRAHEERAYPVTGDFLDEISSEILSLVDMMEPYYKQCGADARACALLDRISGMRLEAETSEGF